MIIAKIMPVLALFGLLFFTDLHAQAQNFNTSSTEVFPDTSSWVLVRMVGAKAKKQHVGNKTFIVLDKREQKISGYTSCNTFKGKSTLKDSTISIVEITIGKRVCDDLTSEMELQLKDFLEKSTTWKITNQTLYFYEKGVLIMEFKAAIER